jgi:mRNA-degrading endonuclease toxin of MazEF toxin-antitoxin module
VPAFSQGTIVWARMLDPRGRTPKLRPGVVLNHNRQPGDQIVVAALTTTFDEPLAPELVEIPCDSTTLLKRRSVVKCDWLIALDESDVASVGGTVSPSAMMEIIRKLPRRPS